MDNAAAPRMSGAMEFDTDVVVAGGGLNGTTTALALASGGLDVTLVDPAPPAERGRPFDGRAYALAVGSRRVLSALGVWDALGAEAQPILRIKVGDGRVGEPPSPLHLTFDAGEIEEGPVGHMVEDRHLRPALQSAAETAGVEMVAGTGVTSHEVRTAGVRVGLGDGRELEARLLLGAEGQGSDTARRAGLTAIVRPYRQSALVSAVAHERPHGGVAHQLFLPGGPLAILPLKGNRSSIVWTEDRVVAEAVAARDDEGYLAALRPRFGTFLGEIRLDGARHAYPLVRSIVDPFVADRVALLGDAAHAVHPIAGQGLNAGLKDAAALAEVVVTAHRRGEDVGRRDVLERYQRWRRFDATTLAVATDGFNRLFSNDSAVLRGLRDLGLAAVDAAPGLRRAFMREAAGLTGDLPRLARGLPL